MLSAILAVTLALSPQTAAEVVVGVRVHGNVLTPDAEVLRLSGLVVGAPFEPGLLGQVESRLRASKRFERVEVLKRFASIADASAILVVVVVDEGPVRIERTGDPSEPVRVVRARSRVMFLPILGFEDGYGLTYGARFTVPTIAGQDSRLSFPLSWGGDKRVAVEFGKDLQRGPLTRVEGGGSAARRTNPFFRADDERARLWVRGERRLAPWMRVGAGTERQHVSFLASNDRFVQTGGDVTFDTRRDPVLARNAVYARAAWNHVALPTGGVNRTSLVARAYVGVIGQTVAIVGLQHEGASSPLPPYLQPLLGGMANLRGFAAGTAGGDKLLATSAELRIPLVSPISISKVGVSAFIDSGFVYPVGQHWTDQRFENGVGGTVWFSAAFFRMSFAVAHGLGATTRVHFGAALSL